MKDALKLLALACYIIPAGLYATAIDLFRRPAPPSEQTGIASWYGERYRGKKMANGQRFLPESMTCASFDYPLGTVLVVSYLTRSVTVTVTDRGPARRLGRLIDLSSGAFDELAPLGIGTITVTVRVKGRAP